jgi:hypothetical protein
MRGEATVMSAGRVQRLDIESRNFTGCMSENPWIYKGLPADALHQNSAKRYADSLGTLDRIPGSYRPRFRYNVSRQSFKS